VKRGDIGGAILVGNVGPSPLMREYVDVMLARGVSSGKKLIE
jgi:hypothetical protein